MSDVGWTTEREEMLAKLWNEGASASEAARTLGGFEHIKDNGRSAILGKIHRMGIQRYTKKSPEDLAREIEARRIRSERLAKERYERNLAKRRKVQEIFDTQAHEEERKSFEIPFNDLPMFSSRTSNRCRYIKNDAAPFIACGAITPPGESWCPHCRDIVKAKPAPILSDAERFRRAMAFKKNALSAVMTRMPTATDEAA